MADANAGTQVTDVVVHPLVLLSVVDHYNRVAKVSLLLLASLQGSL